MGAEQLVPRRETCERLIGPDGFPKRTHFAWFEARQPGEFTVGEWDIDGIYWSFVAPAPTLAEIMAELPELASVFRLGGAWHGTTATLPVKQSEADNPTEAAALLWLALNEKGER